METLFKFINVLFLPIIEYNKNKKANRLLRYYDLYEKSEGVESYKIKFRNKITLLAMLEDDFEPFVLEFLNYGKKYDKEEIIVKL